MLRKAKINKVSKYLLSVGTILIILSIILLIKNKVEDALAGIASNKILNIIESKTSINEEVTNEEEMKTINIDNNDYIGIINLPSLNIKLPVMSETSYHKLTISPCRYYGSVYTNDLIICAHNYTNHFRNLNKLKQDDIIIFTDTSNKDYIYEVKLIEELAPTDITNMIENDFDLTLYTCNYDGSKRITIRCKRVYNYIKN